MFKAIRTSRTVNLADPTQVTVWKLSLGPKQFRIRLTLVCSWDVEANLDAITGWSRLLPPPWRFRTFHLLRCYGWRSANWLYGYLEDRWTREQMKYDDEPF